MTLTRGFARDLSKSKVKTLGSKENICIYGAGSAGVLLARAIKDDGIYNILCFVDESPKLWNREIDGIPIVSPDFLQEPDHKIKKAAMNADIHEFIAKSLDGYNTIVGEGGNTLSGGQKQRISIARAILKDAPILLLDEATSSLDAETESEINKTLETLTKNKTTITIAHRLSTIINSDQIILISKGKIVDVGSHKELIKSSDYYKKLYVSEA